MIHSRMRISDKPFRRGAATIAQSVSLRSASLLLLCLVVVSSARSQQVQPLPEQPKDQQKGQQNGMSTGIARPAVKDAKNRPITAGGFVDGAPVIFADATHSSGLDKFHHKMGAPEKNVILETPGSGVALIDYD